MNKAKKILIMGLPGAGKTYLANILYKILMQFDQCRQVRSEANDWDFSPEGRKRQANRMKNLAIAH